MNRAWASTCFLSTNTLSEQEYRELAREHAQVAAGHAQRASNPRCTVILNDQRFQGLSETGRYRFADLFADEVRAVLGDHCLYCAVDAGGRSDLVIDRMYARITTAKSSLRHE